VLDELERSGVKLQRARRRGRHGGYDAPDPHHLTNADMQNYQVMQYTCLKDKAGKEIFEGDLVRIDDEARPFEIKWRVSGFIIERQMHPDYGDNDYGWIMDSLVDLKNFNGDDTITDLTVIGNIYENPELSIG
jgi:uncharacterized phage protein (TIGR01671 family)